MLSNHWLIPELIVLDVTTDEAKINKEGVKTEKACKSNDSRLFVFRSQIVHVFSLKRKV